MKLKDDARCDAAHESRKRSMAWLLVKPDSQATVSPKNDPELFEHLYVGQETNADLYAWSAPAQNHPQLLRLVKRREVWEAAALIIGKGVVVLGGRD
eukprot:scaffold63541_cov19-Tisochrysis_lutea.AAC.2